MKFFLRFMVVSLTFSHLMILSGCSGFEDFKETGNGLKYKFHVENTDATKVQLYDVVEVYMNYRSKDSTLFLGGKTKIPFQIEPVYDGDLMEGIMMMHKGDSATFVINSRDFFLKMMQYEKVPDHAKNIDDLYFDIKVVNISPETPAIKAKRLQIKERKETEKDRIAKFVRENDITEQPAESGLYYIEIEQGEGEKAVAGRKVKVHYNGTFLDGSKYDSSYERGFPIIFTLGDGEVIAGWEEAIAKMRAGGKARIIVPSALAYGGKQRDNVKPYTPLVFDIELVEVEKETHFK